MSLTVGLPGVDWIFVHGEGGLGSLALLRDDPDLAESDAEGYAGTTRVRHPLRGLVALQNAAETPYGATVGVRVDAVCALPRGTPVDSTDWLEVVGIDPHLDGIYMISAVRPTWVHLRLLLTRIRDADAQA